MFCGLIGLIWDFRLIEDLDGKVTEATGRVEINIQKLERLMKTKSRDFLFWNRKDELIG
jgi:hypothetical protein